MTQSKRHPIPILAIRSMKKFLNINKTLCSLLHYIFISSAALHLQLLVLVLLAHHRLSDVKVNLDFCSLLPRSTLPWWPDHQSDYLCQTFYVTIQLLVLALALEKDSPMTWTLSSGLRLHPYSPRPPSTSHFVPFSKNKSQLLKNKIISFHFFGTKCGRVLTSQK